MTNSIRKSSDSTSTPPTTEPSQPESSPTTIEVFPDDQRAEIDPLVVAFRFPRWLDKCQPIASEPTFLRRLPPQSFDIEYLDQLYENAPKTFRFFDMDVCTLIMIQPPTSNNPPYAVVDTTQIASRIIEHYWDQGVVIELEVKLQGRIWIRVVMFSLLFIYFFIQAAAIFCKNLDRKP